jgi:predicted lysophospholipase L1 biosynthesis ABC-type transport system permease subunit
VPLETYYPPELEPADAAAKRALQGRRLLPTENLGDYIQQPPLLLTTLSGAQAFLSSRSFKGASSKAPISVIRVRVEGVNGPDELSMARIRAVALAIHDKTNLDVDVTAGSSPRELLLHLPAGRFGRPPLLLKEGWVKKGVSVAFLRAVDRKSLGLFALILATCCFYLANGAFAAARARRTEIGTLLCLGWSQGAIFRVLLGELVLIGVVAGLLGTAIAATVTRVFALQSSLAWTLLVLPVSVALAVVAGLVPAWLAAASVPLDAVRPPVAEKAHTRRRVNSVRGMAWVNLRRLPVRTMLGAGGLCVGVAALALLLGIERAFHGTLVGTLLGNAILVRVSRLDFVALALVILLAAFSVADVLVLNLRERAAELVTLRTSGWGEAETRRLIGFEALGLGAMGALGGAALALIAGLGFLGLPPLSLIVATMAAAAGGIAVALAASVAPLSQINRLTAPTVLAEE